MIAIVRVVIPKVLWVVDGLHFDTDRPLETRVGSLPPRTNFGTFLRAAAEGTVFRVQVDSQLTEPLTLRYEGDDAETVTDMQVATQAAAVINKAANEARALHSRSSER